ncbi:MAG: TraR/DksA family transcriptional regulator [Patescibacteria group bacterium]
MKNANIPENILNELKTELESKLTQINEDLKILKEEDPYMVIDRDEGNADWQDETQEDMGRNSVDMKMESLTQARIKVEKALAKMDEGIYGICEKSGKPIDVERLKAYPEAAYSIEYASDE